MATKQTNRCKASFKTASMSGSVEGNVRGVVESLFWHVPLESQASTIEELQKTHEKMKAHAAQKPS